MGNISLLTEVRESGLRPTNDVVDDEAAKLTFWKLVKDSKLNDLVEDLRKDDLSAGQTLTVGRRRRRRTFFFSFTPRTPTMR